MGTTKRTWDIEEKVSILKDIEKTGVVEGCGNSTWEKQNDAYY